MKDAQARTIYLKDYQPPGYLINNTFLKFELYEDYCLVKSRLDMCINSASVNNQASQKASLVLQGQELQLEKLIVNGEILTENQYSIDDDSLTIFNVPELFVLECETRIKPQDNTSLEGLYKSKKMFCTQCEAEGFRKITYYLDRPDVMSKFTTLIEADKKRYPVLLSNS